ncbi:MAG TPA: toll/interleukin-1 receptor domain-containing protein [Pyrinomonadaceae bacterium]|nr:toll/interleukin-1 receptor domain-containing protein [Pyrinomonadaceae bacterium]
MLTDSNDLHRPSIIATSGYPNLVEDAIKAGAVGILQPHLYENLAKIVRNLANQGRRRRLYKLDPKGDASRHKRPVFLSFASDYRGLATGLKSHIEAEDIGVWYSRDLVADNEPWPPHVVKGIDKAAVFLALVTEHFLTSRHCSSELDRFNERKKRDPNALLLPIFYGSTIPSGRFNGSFDGLKSIDLSGGAFMDGVQEMVRFVRETVH